MTPKAAFFFEKINKSNKPLARLNREREREYKLPISGMREVLLL